MIPDVKLIQERRHPGLTECIETKDMAERKQKMEDLCCVCIHRPPATPNKLSGGQKQRVSIAGVLAMHPKCIVLDEPTAMLDPKGRMEVMKTVRLLNRNYGITVILITHYMEEAAQADRVIVMDDGNILLDDTPAEVFSHVEEMKTVGLDVPQVTELVYELQKAGMPLDGHIISEDACVDAILKCMA